MARLVFCLFRYFPYGGLQRDFMRIAKACYDKGHSIHVYTMSWEAEIPTWMQVEILPKKGLTNSSRAKHFAKIVQQKLKNNFFDLVIGFNKMPGLDVYYAADGCFIGDEKYQKNFFKKLLPRYRSFSKLEKSVFSTDSNTKILLISPREKIIYQIFYKTQEIRLFILPPGVAPDRKLPTDAQSVRNKLRQQYELSANDFLLLMIGSSFKTKGVDRAIQAVSTVKKKINNKVKLIIIGADDSKIYKRLANKLNVEHEVSFINATENIVPYFAAADLLVHPARKENTGTVIIEALVCGVPSLVTDNCGYAFHVQQARVGKVIPSPFEQKIMDQQLIEMLDHDLLKQLKQNCFEYAEKTDLYSLIDKAVFYIEKFLADKPREFHR